MIAVSGTARSLVLDGATVVRIVLLLWASARKPILIPAGHPIVAPDHHWHRNPHQSRFEGGWLGRTLLGKVVAPKMSLTSLPPAVSLLRDQRRLIS
jgi:hypothetical protein